MTLDRRLDDLYRRLGARYLDALLLATVPPIVLLVVVPGYTALLLPIFSPSFEAYLACVAGYELALGLIAVPLMFRLAHRMLPAAYRWAADGPASGDAVAVWDATVRGLPRFVAAVVALFALCCFPAALYTAGRLDFAWYGYPIYLGTLSALIGVVGLFFYLVLEQGLRPLVRDVARHLAPDARTSARALGLGTKSIALIPAINVLTAIITGAVARSQTGSPELYMGVVVASSIAVSSSFSLVLTLLFRHSVLQRIDDLRGAMGRVEAGNLDVRVDPVAGDELDRIASSFNALTIGLRERAALHSAFGHYVDPTIAEQVLSEGEVVSGVEVEVTIVFVDLRGFTALAERLPPTELVATLNGFFSVVLPVIHEHGGHANRLLGDGVLAVFGAPEPLPDHADRALAAAVSIAHVVDERLPPELRAGLGLNTGTVVAGTVGAEGKLDYTFIGDAVNIAARVEALTRTTGDDILLTAATRDRLHHPAPVPFVPRGRHAVKGKAERLEILAARLHVEARP